MFIEQATFVITLHHAEVSYAECHYKIPNPGIAFLYHNILVWIKFPYVCLKVTWKVVHYCN